MQVGEELVSVSLLPVPVKAKMKRPYRGNDAFGVLGVSPDASTKEIERAYRRLARKYHPDVNRSPNARQKFVRINQAYTFIMKRGDLVRLQLSCKMAEVKTAYAEMLQTHKRARDLSGIEIDPPEPRPEYFRETELAKKMRSLSWHMMWECPTCRWREKCDRATGYGEVKEIHYEIQGKLMNKFFGSLAP